MLIKRGRGGGGGHDKQSERSSRRYEEVKMIKVDVRKRKKKNK